MSETSPNVSNFHEMLTTSPKRQQPIQKRQKFPETSGSHQKTSGTSLKRQGPPCNVRNLPKRQQLPWNVSNLPQNGSIFHEIALKRQEPPWNVSNLPKNVRNLPKRQQLPWNVINLPQKVSNRPNVRKQHETSVISLKRQKPSQTY